MKRFQNRRATNKMHRIAGLDGLRAIAAIAVITYHIFPMTFRGGYLGVSLFFLLSGYLITRTSIFQWSNQTFEIPGFYRSRFYRIYPSLGVVLLTTIVFFIISFPGESVINWKELLSILTGTNNLWQIAQNTSYFTKISNSSPFTHLWSLSIELQFYLLYPLFLYFFLRIRQSFLRKAAPLFFLLLAVATTFIMPVMFHHTSDLSRVYYGTDTRISPFFWGCFLAVLPLENTETRILRNPVIKKTLFGFLSLGALILFLKLEGQSPFTYQGGMLLADLTFASLLYLIITNPQTFGTYLENRPLVWLGQKSYEIYLWQYPVIYYFESNGWTNTFYGKAAALFVILALAMATSYIVNIRQSITWNIRTRKRLSLLLLISVSILLSLVLRYSHVNQKAAAADQVSLEKELALNSKFLEEQRASGNTETESQTAPSEAASEPVSEPAQAAAPAADPAASNVSTEQITALGDSVMLGAAPALQSLLPNCTIDAKPSRLVSEARAIFESMQQNGQLSNTVIIGLGTNSLFSSATGQSLIDFLGKDRKIYWINVYGQHLEWKDEVNSDIQKLADQNSNVTVIDWNTYAASHPDWFRPDGIHLGAEGQKGYAQFILDSISK